MPFVLLEKISVCGGGKGTRMGSFLTCLFPSFPSPSTTGYLRHTEEPSYQIHIGPVISQLIERKMGKTKNENDKFLYTFFKTQRHAH